MVDQSILNLHTSHMEEELQATLSVLFLSLLYRRFRSWLQEEVLRVHCQQMHWAGLEEEVWAWHWVPLVKEGEGVEALCKYSGTSLQAFLMI